MRMVTKEPVKSAKRVGRLGKPSKGAGMVLSKNFATKALVANPRRRLWGRPNPAGVRRVCSGRQPEVLLTHNWASDVREMRAIKSGTKNGGGKLRAAEGRRECSVDSEQESSRVRTLFEDDPATTGCSVG